MRRIGWCLVVAFQFVFSVCSLYRRVYVHGRGIPNKVEHRGRYIWEARGMAPDYCFRLFLGHACFVIAALVCLPDSFSHELGFIVFLSVVLDNYFGFLYEKRRWLRTNREISEAEQLMSERVKDFQKTDVHA